MIQGFKVHIKKISLLGIRISSLIFSYLILFIVTNSENGVSVYGKYSYYFSFISLYSIFLKFGFDTMIMRVKYTTSNEIKDIFSNFYFINLVHLFLSALLYLIMEIPFYIILSAHFFSFSYILSELLRRNSLVFLFILFSNSLFLILQFIILLILGNSDLPFVLFCSYFLNFILIFLFCYYHFKNDILVYPSVISFNLYKQYLYACILDVSNSFNNQGIVYLMSFFTSSEVLGVFSICKRISNGIALPYQIINISNAPVFANLKNDISSFNLYLKKQSRLFFYSGFLFPLFSCLFIYFIPDFLNLSIDLYILFYSFCIILFIGRSLNGLTGPTFTLIKLFGDLKHTAKTQFILYFSSFTIIGISSLFFKYYQLDEFFISVFICFVFSVSLVLLNFIYFSNLKNKYKLKIRLFL